MDESEDLPTNDVFAEYHVVLVRAKSDYVLPMVAARLRAKPRFGRRLLIALVPESVSEQTKREAVVSGFDQAMSEHCAAREIAATILRLLRPYPEYRCMLSPTGRRKAA